MSGVSKKPDTEQRTILEDRTRDVIKALTAGVVAVDGAGRIVAANPAAAGHLHVAEEALAIGERIDEIPELRPLHNIYHEVLETNTAMFRREVILGDNGWDQKEIGVSVSLLDGGNAFDGAVFLFSDLTERRKLERAAEVNRQLAALGELAAGVVHELRNPLTIIKGRAELLMRRVSEDSASTDSAEAIVSEVKLLERTISQFLAFSKPFELQPVRCEVRAILDRVRQLCKEAARAKNAELKLTQQGEFDQIVADFNRLAEALSNIVTNAIDAVPEGGRIEVEVFQEGATTVFQCRDNGPGIDLNSGQNLFSPFFTQKRDGTGLGLSIVQRIVTAHGGAITYKNRDEGGAQFDARIPTHALAYATPGD